MGYRAVSLACGFALIAIGHSGQLSSESAQTLLDEELGQGAVEVVGMRATSGSEAVARVTRSGSTTDPEITVTFTLGATGWRPGNAEMAGQTFPLAQLISAIDQGRQRRTMASMRLIAAANGTMRVETGGYALTVGELERRGYLRGRPQSDEWGNAFTYMYLAPQDSYTLMSLGSDGQMGPAPPSRWPASPYEPDIVLSDGRFTQAPTGQ